MLVCVLLSVTPIKYVVTYLTFLILTCCLCTFYFYPILHSILPSASIDVREEKPNYVREKQANHEIPKHTRNKVRLIPLYCIGVNSSILSAGRSLPRRNHWETPQRIINRFTKWRDTYIPTYLVWVSSKCMKIYCIASKQPRFIRWR